MWTKRSIKYQQSIQYFKKDIKGKYYLFTCTTNILPSYKFALTYIHICTYTIYAIYIYLFKYRDCKKFPIKYKYWRISRKMQPSR